MATWHGFLTRRPLTQDRSAADLLADLCACHHLSPKPDGPWQVDGTLSFWQRMELVSAYPLLPLTPQELEKTPNGPFSYNIAFRTRGNHVLILTERSYKLASALWNKFLNPILIPRLEPLEIRVDRFVRMIPNDCYRITYLQCEVNSDGPAINKLLWYGEDIAISGIFQRENPKCTFSSCGVGVRPNEYGYVAVREQVACIRSNGGITCQINTRTHVRLVEDLLVYLEDNDLIHTMQRRKD